MIERRHDVTLRGASELVGALRSGEFTASQLAEAYLARIEQLDNDIQAFITVDPEAVRRAARAADHRRQSGTALGALNGIPVAVKDLIDTAGLRTTYGCSLFRDHVPTVDDAVVQRLRAAGAIILGKTNTPEFGFGAITSNRLRGPTRNPHALALTTGGSSGGSAAAVCAGMSPLAVGTDFGGSVRTPASFCGVVGVRPTPGLVPQVPKRLPWETLHVYGAMARSVEDAALLLEVMSGGDDRDPLSVGRAPLAKLSLEPSARRPRLAVALDLGVIDIDHDVREALSRSIDAMRAQGLSITEAGPDCAGARESFETLRAGVLYQSLGHHLGYEGLSPTVRWNVERGRNLTAKELLDAEMARGIIYRRFMDFFADFDFLLTATASVPPFTNDQGGVTEINRKPLANIIDYLAVTYVFSLVGLPALSLPAAWTRAGLPIGLQIIGKPFSEPRLLSFAFRLQEELGFRYRAPTGL